MVVINEEDIGHAEKQLLRPGETFDLERVNFIKNFETLDLHAAPGSGKTTALLAKLLILNRYLPFADDAGILIISHTNAAVDEIKNKLGLQCNKLLSYPNYIGTIQGFVDTFLAEPYYSNRFKKKIYRIDDGVYKEEMGKLMQYCLRGEKRDTYTKILGILHAIKDYVTSFRFGLDTAGRDVLLDDINGSALNIKKPKGNTRTENYRDFSVEEKKGIHDYLVKLKLELFKKGILCYDDPYFLAQKYLFFHPGAQELLCKRFKMVFVDEMQDMALHQINILDKIFFNGVTKSVFQRIGDKNQAIYNSRSFPKTDPWNSLGRTILTLNGSQRFNQEIANKVKPFGETFIDIQGKASRPNYKPLIILYNNNSISKVLGEYAKSIKTHIVENNITLTSRDHIKAIGWRKTTEKGASILSYFPEYDHTGSILKIDHENLHATIFALCQAEYKELGPIRKALLLALVKLFRIEGVSINPEGFFTYNDFLNSVKAKSEISYMKFNEVLYEICIKVYKRDIVGAHSKSKKLIERSFKIYFPDNEISDTGQLFLNNTNDTEGVQIPPRNLKSIYKCQETGININVETIHAVKGQTHWGTLYLETFYQGKHESELLIDQLTGTSFNKPGVYAKQTTRMMYVGLSRPTEILAFACHIDRVRNKLPDLRNSWAINENLIQT